MSHAGFIVGSVHGGAAADCSEALCRLSAPDLPDEPPVTGGRAAARRMTDAAYAYEPTEEPSFVTALREKRANRG